MRRLTLIVLVGAMAISASAANFSGKWATVTTDNRGRTMRTTLNLNHVGSEVSGSVGSGAGLSSGSPSGSAIYGGKASGDTITFYVWIGQDRPVKRVFRGTMSGDEIHFTMTGSPVRFSVTGERLEPPGPQEATAQRIR